MSATEPHTTSSSSVVDLEARFRGLMEEHVDDLQCYHAANRALYAFAKDALAEVSRLQDQLAHLTGYADGLKRGSDLHEQRRGELEKQVAKLQAVVGAARVLFGRVGTTPSQIHHPACGVFGATVVGGDCDCGAQEIRAALARLGDAADAPDWQKVYEESAPQRIADRAARIGLVLPDLVGAADVPADHAVPAASTGENE